MENATDDTTQVEIDSYITKASAAGWKPLEAYEGDPEQWVDAKEFVKRAPLYEKTHKLKKELADLKTTLHEVKGHISKVSQAAYEKAVRDLNEQRNMAIDNGDREAVREIDTAIKDAESIKVNQDNTPPAIKEWEDQNGKWFYADDEISGFGLAFAQNYLKQHPNDFSGAMEKMEGAIKKAFPEKFENVKRKAPPAVEPGNNGHVKKTYTSADLNDEQRRVVNRFVRDGVMTEADYIKELVDSGIIGGKK